MHVDRHDNRRRWQFAEGQPRRRLGELPSRDTGDARVDDVRIALAVLIIVTAVGCSGLPKDGRYQTGGGGWDNFRAAAPEVLTERST
jgi:hypothetical protein